MVAITADLISAQLHKLLGLCNTTMVILDKVFN